MMHRVTAAQSLLRLSQLTLGGLLIVAAPVAAPLPGPAGTLLFLGGAALILRASPAARRRWARAGRRWPRIRALTDRLMRRPSDRRRRERAAAD
jgi:hypothetical protein